MPSKNINISGLELLKILPDLLLNAPDTLTKISAGQKNILKIGFNKDYFLFLTQPDQYKYVLKTNSSNYPRGKSAADLKPILGNGIFISGEEDWKRQRHYLAPAFHTKFFEDFYPIVNDEVERFIFHINRVAEKGLSVNFSFELKKLAARISFRTMFINDKELLKDDLLHALDMIYENASFYKHSMRQAFRLLFKREDAFGYGRKVKPAFELIDRAARDIFERCHHGEAVPMEFVRVLVEEVNAGRIDRQEAVDEIKNIIFAGYDTVGETLTWLWFVISSESKYSQMVRDEVYAVCKGLPPALSQLSDLSMLLMFIKETMRLYPVVWAFHRIAKEDDEIEGYKVKRNEWIMMSPYVMHRNPDFWPDPDRFNPFRFEGDNNTVPVRYDYLPFGQGPHVCLGNRLGMFELQVILGTIIQNYNFVFEKKHPGITADILIRQKKKLYMDILKVAHYA